MAGSISFVRFPVEIDHPTKEGKKLVHGVLEGPEHGVYVRGKLDGETRIKLPSYWTGLVDENSLSVQLTPIGLPCTHYIKSINNNEVIIGCECSDVKCFYLVQGERKDVNKLEVEKD